MAAACDARALRRPKPCGARRAGRAPQGSPGLGRSYPKYGASGVGSRQRWIEGPLPKGRPGNSTGVRIDLGFTRDRHSGASLKHRARDVRRGAGPAEDISRVFSFRHETTDLGFTRDRRF
jgi:hypothetical protein